MPLLQVVIASTRQGRLGPLVAEWFLTHAKAHGAFEIEKVDLAEVNLPMFDEPLHPRFRKYEHEHTKRWSATVSRADAFVFVTPEYNHVSPPALINALDYLVHEWAYKAAGFVSYGGVSGGTRSVEVTKMVLTGLKMVPVMEGVNLPFFNQSIDKEKTAFSPPDVQGNAATVMLDELLRWTNALKVLR